MKTRFLKIISGMALATVLTLAVTQVSAFAQSVQKQQGIEGVWDVRITVVQCDTSQALFGGRAILMFGEGGGLTAITDNFLHSAALGTWHHLRGRSYTAVNRFFVFNADGSFAGTQVTTVEIELSTDANAFTDTATFELSNASDQVISSGCATATATRLE